MANASSGVGISTSNIITSFDILKPEVRNQLFRSRGDQGNSAFNMLQSLGYTRGISQDTAVSYEENWIHPTLHANAAVSSVAATNTQGVPNVQNIVVSSGTGNNDYLSFSYGNSATYYYVPVQPWDIIQYPNGVTGLVTNVAGQGTSAVTITVTSQDATVALPAVAQYDELIITSNAFPEGSDQPDGIQNKPVKSTAYLQIIKAGYRWTGTQATNASWFTTYKSDGDIPAYYLKGQMDADYELTLKIDGAILFGNKTLSTIYDSSSFAASGFENVKTTEGMIPYVRNNGNQKQYTPGTFQIQTFNDMVKIFDREYAPKYICGMLGIDLDLEIEDALKSYFQNTNINYIRQQMVADIFKGNAALEASVGFNVLNKGDFTFCFTRMPIFSHQKLYGATGYKNKGLGLFVPMSTKRDLKNDQNVPYFGVIHKELGNYNRKAEVWTLQGAAPGTKVFSKDINQLCMRSHIGAEHVGANQCILLDPQ